LLFAAGAERPDPNNRIHTVDHLDIWQLDLNTPLTQATWTCTGIPFPYHSNHIGHASIMINTKTQQERYFAVSGQVV
jgi:hypothetical protein